MLTLVWLGLVYLASSVPAGVILTLLFSEGADPRYAGSGNIGATNVLRTNGRTIAALTLCADFSKGLVSVSLGHALWPDGGPAWWAATAMIAFIGHCFPIYLGFRGGKGVATGAGAMAWIAPTPTLSAALLWVLVVRLSGRVSLASIVAAITLLATVFAWYPYARMAVTGLALGVLLRHEPNLRRLWRGHEARVSAAVALPAQDMSGQATGDVGPAEE